MLKIVKMATFEEEFISFAEEVFKSFGLDCLSSKLIGIIYLEPKEISMENLSKQTGYSLASISNKMKLLEGIGIVQRVKKPGTKRVFYFMDKSIINIIKRKVQLSYEKEVLPAKKRIPEIIEKYKGTAMDSNEKDKMDIIKEYYNQILKVEKIIGHINKQIDKLK